MNKKIELQQIIDNARNELFVIEDEERHRVNSNFISKYYKYRNSYSCPKENEYWWIYQKIVDVDRHGILYSLQFQKDIFGEIRINSHEHTYMTNWIEITKEEFLEEFKKIVDEINLYYNKIDVLLE
jgi:hypothetical protein